MARSGAHAKAIGQLLGVPHRTVLHWLHEAGRRKFVDTRLAASLWMIDMPREDMARLLGCTVPQVRAVARRLGLPAKKRDMGDVGRTAVVRRLRECMDTKVVAKEFGISREHVRRLGRAAGVKLPSGLRRKQPEDHPWRRSAAA